MKETSLGKEPPVKYSNSVRIINSIILFFFLISWPLLSNAAFSFLLYEKLRHQRYEDIYKKGADLFSNGHIKESIPYIIQFVDFQEKDKLIPNTMLFLSEEERNVFWREHKKPYTEMLPRIACETKEDSLIEKAYNAVLLSKGILLNSTLSIEKLLDTLKDDSLKATYDEYMKSIKLYQESSDVDSTKLNGIEKNIAYLRSKLKQNPYLELFGTLLTIKWNHVYANLKGNDIAIEFFDFPLDNMEHMYVALTLQNGKEKPSLIPLFKESELPIGKTYPMVDERLAYNLIWGKLKPCLKDVSNIFFSPSGVLHRIAIEYLPDEDGLPINWQYNMYRLSSTRELIFAKPVKNENLTCTLWGDFNYTLDQEPKRMINSDGININYSFGNQTSRDLRKAINDDITYLPMTRVEIRHICSSALHQGHKYKAFIGDDGTEEQFRNLSGKKVDVIHIATHGFYIPLETEDNSSEESMLTRTGLIMAGVNNMRKSDSRKEDPSCDGILTSMEVSQMDLSSTDLVTLSACGTGLGDVTSDGVYGLQRAFKKAGVQSELVSLWDVDDEATSYFMKSFYHFYFESKNKSLSLRLAQQALTQYQSGKYNNRKYWSAFVLVDGINQHDSSNPEMLADGINIINKRKAEMSRIQTDNFKNNSSIWRAAEQAAIEVAGDEELSNKEKNENYWELEEDTIPKQLEKIKKRLEKIERELEKESKDDTPSFGLG